MKKTLQRLLALVATLLVAAAHAGSFGGEKVISTDPSLGSQFPEVAYYNNIIHVVFVGYAPGKLGDIFYSRSTNAGSTFSAPVNLSGNATASTGNDRPQVTAGPNGVFVAWNSDNDTGAIYARRSTDGGATFAAAAVVAGAEGDSFYARLTGLHTDAAGRVHLVYYQNQDTAGVAGMIHHRMNCTGAAWGADEAVTSKDIDGDVDNEQPRIGSTSGGQVYLVFRSSRNGNPQGGWPPYSMHMQAGTVNGGACTTAWTYPARRIAGGIPWTFNTVYRPEVFGDSGGNLHLAYWDTTAGANVYYRKGNPAAALFGAVQKVSAFAVDHLEPGALASTSALAQGGFQVPPAIVSNGTTAFMAYQKNQQVTAGTFENGPIYLRESADNGTTWGAEQSISSFTTATTPRMAIGGAGNQNVAIVFSDLRGASSARVYFRLYTLGAIGGGPEFDLSPATQNYGNVAVGATSSAVTYTLVNSGTAGNISSITVDGNYARTGGTCAAGPLAGGASCTITVAFSPTALGVRAGTVTVATDAFSSPHIANLTGTGVASASFAANVSAVVTGYYETILGRAPDAGGLTFWSAEATRVTGLGADVREVFFAMSISFFGSTEYANRGRTDTEFLTDMYRTFFIREPDAPGLAFWQGELTAIGSRSALLNSFLFSTEFSNQMAAIFGTTTVRPELNMTIDLYRGALGRLPDSDGFNFWLGRIRQAQCLGAAAVSTEVNNLAALFFQSAEYANRARGDRDFVGDLYNAFLRRGPGGDSAGFNFWVGQVSTQGRDFVRSQFVPSAEFQARVTQVIAAGCLP